MDQTILKSHVEIPKKFKGSNFRWCQQKILFYLTSLHVSYIKVQPQKRRQYDGGSGQKNGKKNYTHQKTNNFKKVYHCWVCGKPRHKAKDWRHKREHGSENSEGNSNQANHVESPKEFAEVIESFLTTNVVDWWFDTGVTKYICNLRKMFVSYQKVNEIETMFIGNGSASKIARKGKFILNLTSGKDLGCLAKFQIPLPKRTKLGPKTIDYVYLGPTKNSDAYRFLVYKINVADISNNTIIESAEVELFENTFPYMDKDKQISNQRKQVLDDQLSQDHRNNTFHVLQENVEPKRSKRAKVNKDFGPDL
ncbi:hypothetical protein Tco_0020332 [Tanacetum coccineum]